MKPLNSQERTKQFFIFLAFFIVTMALVIGVVYFNAIYNPKHHNELLIQRNKELEQKITSNEKHLSEINSVYANINTLNDEITDPKKSSSVDEDIQKGEWGNTKIMEKFDNKDDSNNVAKQYFKLSNLTYSILRQYQKSKTKADGYDKKVAENNDLQKQLDVFRKKD